MTKYDINLLLNIIERDNCIINDIPKKINYKTKITFICNCGTERIKTFKLLNISGSNCIICANKLQLEKMKQTCLKRYGVECVSQLEENKEKMKQTCLKKYGVESVSQIREYQEKREQTNLIKYGVKNGFQSKDIIEKSEQTRLIKYGVKHATQSIIFLQKREQTWLNKYGVNNPTQNAEISEKTKKYKQKEFIFPDNVIINVQGYEHWALEELVNQGFTSNTIITSRTQVPEIWYFNGKNHRYFVDI